MREPHPLTGTKRSVVPRRMIFFDSEAYTEIAITDEETKRAEQGEKVEKPHLPYLVGASFYHRRKDQKPVKRTREYWERSPGQSFLKQFWEDVDAYARSNTRTWVFAHNAKYDMQVTEGVHWLVQMGYEVTGFSDANPFILKLQKPVRLDKYGRPYMAFDRELGEWVEKPRKKTLIILSSTNYYSQSLASLGKIFGLPKLDFPHGKRVDMNDPEDQAHALTYLGRDIEILEVAMLHFIDFIEREDLGPFGMTVAGQAFTAFRHRFIEDGKIFIHSNKSVLEVERRAYAGGRNECFQIGRIPERVIVADINSMYPFVMKEYRYPTRLVTFWREATPERVREAIMDDYLIVCDVVLESRDINQFHKKEKRLIFPCGTYATTLTTPELIEAFGAGMVRSVSNVCVYEGENIFEPYVDFFYGARLRAKDEGDEIHDHLYKIFLNSLYGKFGQLNRTWEAIAEADPEAIGIETIYSNGKVSYVKIFGGHIWEKNSDEDDEESFNSFPAVAAHVTGYARMLIWKVIEASGRGNVYYTDTDSVFVNEEGYAGLLDAGLVDKKRLGALKFEKAGTLWLNGCKDYMGVWETRKIKYHPVKMPRTLPRPRMKRFRKRCGRSWRWVSKILNPPLPATIRPAKLYYKEVKIKGIPKSAVPLEPDDQGRLRFAVTQWGGFTDRFKAKDFRSYSNKVIIKTLKREYVKGDIDGVAVTPFRLDHDAEQQKAEQDALASLRKAAAADRQEDLVRVMCLRYGYIRTPQPGERYYAEYAELPRPTKLKYFRKDGIPFDVWAEDNGFGAAGLLDYLKG